MKIAICLVTYLVTWTMISLNLAVAELGGGANSISSDHIALHAKYRRSIVKENYTVEEITANAATVREYVSQTGVVFGICWDGHSHPDLMQLLGKYSSEYSDSRKNKAKKFGSRRQKLTTKNMIVEKWGHMRSLKGRAYVPTLLPTGVSVDEIK